MISRQCIVPSNWNNNNNIATRHQIRQEEVEAGVVSSSSTAAAVNRSSHHHHHRNHVLNSNQQQILRQIPSSSSSLSTTATATTTTTTTPHLVVPMFESDCEVTELTWENGQLALHGLSGILHSGPTKPTWDKASETLESIVHDPAASQKPNPNWHHDEPHHTPANLSFSPGGKWTDISSGDAGKQAPSFRNKPCQSKPNQCARNFSGNSSSFTTHQDKQKHYVDRSACASASATLCRENDTATITWASFESPGSFKTKTTEEVSACVGGGSENQDEDRETKTETVKPHTCRRRVAAVHNQSERRRRHRINQKLKTLQKLVPNANKTDKASILDEVIDYLKQLQSQVQLMSMRNVPEMMVTLGMQQQLQMSLLARMGLGMMNTSALAVHGGAPQCLPQLLHPTSPAGAATFVPPPFTVPSHMIPTESVIQAGPEPAGTESASAALPDPFGTYLAQSMSMDFYNKMAALYQQQVNQTIQAKSSSPSESDHHVLQGIERGRGEWIL